MEPQIGFCANPDGFRIAYATLGHGPALVIPPAYFHILASIDLLPGLRNFLDRIARYHTVVIYDQRGAGLSDRNRTIFTLESELQDLETVIDHLNLDRIVLEGMSMSGPITIAYTARHPERVSHLILYGTYANYGKLVPKELKESISSLLHSHPWLGMRTLASFVVGNDSAYTELISVAEAENVSPENAAHFMEMLFELDVVRLCPGIKNPTLIMHRKGDQLIDFKAGLELASLIPNARFIPLEGSMHMACFGDAESVLHNTFDFLNDPVTDDKATKAARPATKKSSHDVFISFAFEDRESAAKIYAHLKGSGICPFWCEELTAGGDYPQLLGEAIRNSKSFLLVLSDSSDNSASVRKETTIAHNNRKPIIPVRIKSVLPKNLEYLIANSLFYDAFPQPLEQHLSRLTSDIKKVIGSKADKKEKTKK